MTALDHYLEGERLLAQSKRTPVEALRDEAVPANALLVAQAEAHFLAAQTLIAGLSALDLPAHDYVAWEQVALSPKPKPTAAEFEDVDSCEECETTGRNCAAHGGRPGIPFSPVVGDDRG